MKKLIMCICVCIGAIAAHGQSPDSCIRKIAKDFLVSRGQLSEKTELNSIGLIVYDYINKVDIIDNECLPVQDKLIFYNIRTLSPHSLGYVLVVKHGIYEIIDMREKLETVIKQTLKFGCHNKIENHELLEVLKNILFQYDANIQNDGGVSIKAN